MRFGKISLAALAAASLVSAPVVAQAQTKAPAKVAAKKVERKGAARKQEQKLGGGSGVFLGLLALVAIVGGIVIAAGNNDDTPTSP